MRLSTVRVSLHPVTRGPLPRGLSLTRRPVQIKTATTSPELTEQNDFVSELKKVAVALHTKDQASSGKQKESPKPFQTWKYSIEGYLRFLVESRNVYCTFERIVQSNDTYALFRETGLDRVEALDHDIAWISEEYGLTVPQISDDGASEKYVKILEDLSQTNVPAFICHFYNFYLAHTAGGRMIGKKVADSVLSGAFHRLAFYQYDSDVKLLVNDFKASINRIALDWTIDEKNVALDQTVESFKCAGTILGTLFDDDI